MLGATTCSFAKWLQTMHGSHCGSGKTGETLLSCLMLLYLVVSFWVVLFYQGPGWYAFLLVAYFFLWLPIVCRFIIGSVMTLLILKLLFSLILIVSSVIQGQSWSVLVLLIFLVNFHLLLAYVFYYGRFNMSLLKLMPYLSLSLLCFLIYNDISPDQVSLLVSRNFFSVIGIVTASMVYLAQANLGSKSVFSINPALICFFISCWAQGRSGIISSALLLTGILLCNVFYSKSSIKYLLKVCFFLIIVIAATYDNLPVFYDHLALKFKTHSMTKDSRNDIAREYFNNIDSVSHLVFGYNILNNQFIASYDYNLHNSFIHSHYRFGIASLLLLILVFWGVVQASKKNIVYLAIVIPLLFRFSTDDLAFMGSYDFLFFFFLYKQSKRAFFLERFKFAVIKKDTLA